MPLYTNVNRERMKKYIVVLLIFLFSCQDSKIDELEDLSIQYVTQGRNESLKTEIDHLIVVCDSLYQNDDQYLKIKARVFANLGEYEISNQIMNQVQCDKQKYNL